MLPHKRLGSIPLLALVFFTPASCGAKDKKSGPPLPNVLIFLADDLGYADLGCYGNMTLRTRYIDQLAEEGVRLTHSLATASECTPSRAGLMTGRYPIRSGMAPSTYPGVPFMTASASGLPASELTLAKVAKQAGHITALLGKWDLGWSENRKDPDHHHPLNHGFDYFYGIPLSLIKDFDRRETRKWRENSPNVVWIVSLTSLTSILGTVLLIRMGKVEGVGTVVAVVLMVVIVGACGIGFWVVNSLALLNSFLYRNYHIVEQPVQRAQVTRKLVSEGVEFLEDRHKDRQPFLLLMSWLHVHTPLATGPYFQGRSFRGPYGDAVEEMDWGVGELLVALERLGLGENTLVFFTSDNGGHIEETDYLGRRTGGHNGELKGGKGHGAPDGGIRVPMIVKWQAGGLSPGLTINEPVSLMDLLPTIAAALRVPLPSGRVDGQNLLPLLRREVALSPHRYLFHYCGKEVHAVRYRPRQGTRIWKLVLYEPNYVNGTQHCASTSCSCFAALKLEPPRLYDLTNDPGERRPIQPKDLPEHEVLVEIMQHALDYHRKSLRPAQDMLTLGKMLWRPWKQPLCHFPRFRCRDAKFEGAFEGEEEE